MYSVSERVRLLVLVGERERERRERERERERERRKRSEHFRVFPPTKTDLDNIPEKITTHPTSTSLLEGEIIFILVTLRSMISAGMSNSSTMHSGMAPPQGCCWVGEF